MFKKGDKVYSILRGWGEVIENEGLRVYVKFGYNDLRYYRSDGRYRETDINPELYHTEPVITVPKRRVEHTGWIAINNKQHLNNKGTSHYRKTSFIYNDKDEVIKWVCDSKNYTFQQITYYTEE